MSEGIEVQHPGWNCLNKHATKLYMKALCIRRVRVDRGEGAYREGAHVEGAHMEGGLGTRPEINRAFAVFFWGGGGDVPRWSSHTSSIARTNGEG